MITSERILKNAVMLGGESLYFFKQSIKLRDISSEDITITLDGIPVQKVPENKYLFVDGNGVTYGVIEYCFNEGEVPPTNVPNIVKQLESKNAFPLLCTDDINENNKLVSSPLYIEVAAEKVSASGLGILRDAPGWMNEESYQVLTRVDKPKSDSEPKYSSAPNFDFKFATELQKGSTICRFSVANKDTRFHDKCKTDDNEVLEVDAFVKGNNPYIDQMTDAIEYARDKFKEILKFQIGVIQYSRNESVINNAFNGFYAWLLERAMGDLSRQKLEVDHWFDNLDIIKDYIALSVTTLNSIFNVVAVCKAPTPAKEDLKQILEERAIDLSIFIK